MPAPHKPARDRPVRFTAVLVGLLFASPFVAAAWAQEDQVSEAPEPGEVSDETLLEGAAVYTARCSSCHQPGGAGISGQFPPLIDNPSVADAGYLVDVIVNGLEGPIEVQGVAYDGRMPALSTLSAEEVDALVVYIQSGFASPAGPEPGVVQEDGGGGIAGWLWVTVAAIVAAGLLALSPRIVAANDRLEMSWLDAWAKTAVIVIVFVFFTVYVPDFAMGMDRVAELDELYQQLIGTGIWLAGLGGALWLLWYAHREDRV